MELDIRLMITLGGMLVSVVASFVLTRAKCVELEEDIKAILERPGIMASATRLGNDKEETTRTHIIDLYNAVVASDRLEDIRDSWQKILSGRVEIVGEVLRSGKKTQWTDYA